MAANLDSSFPLLATLGITIPFALLINPWKNPPQTVFLSTIYLAAISLTLFMGVVHLILSFLPADRIISSVTIWFKALACASLVAVFVARICLLEIDASALILSFLVFLSAVLIVVAVPLIIYLFFPEGEDGSRAIELLKRKICTLGGAQP